MCTLDDVDLKIIRALQGNSRITMKELSGQVHMSGPAVTERIKKLEDEGVITGYTLSLDPIKFNKQTMAFITVWMGTPKHNEFLEFCRTRSDVVECHRVAGEGCYLLRVLTDDNSTLEGLIDQVLNYGNYRVSIVMSSPVNNVVIKM